MLKRLVPFAILLASLPAHADDVSCDRVISRAVIDGNVIVPRNASCTLIGTTVLGNVEVRDNGQVLIRANSIVDGNVQTDGAARVRIRYSEIGGNVQLSGVDSNLESIVLHARVGGTVDWNDNSAPFLIRFSTVDSDVKVNQNNTRARVFGNTIGGNLQCKSNLPEPNGGSNTVGGNKENQCANF